MKNHLQDRRIVKASADDRSHPGWPAGTSGGRSGQFRPKTATVGAADWLAIDDSNGATRITRRQVRRTILRSLPSSADMTPLFNDKMATPGSYLNLDDVAQLIVGAGDLATDTKAALKFAEGAPYRLEDLRVSDGEEGFPNYYLFQKDGCLKRFGSAGEGFSYHHLVEQSNEGVVDPNFLHSTANIVRLPTILHEGTYEYYNANSNGPGTPTMRRVLRDQSLDEKFKFGLRVLQSMRLLTFRK